MMEIAAFNSVRLVATTEIILCSPTVSHTIKLLPSSALITQLLWKQYVNYWSNLELRYLEFTISTDGKLIKTNY